MRPIGANRRRAVNVRVVAATNRDLEREMREGRFRPDLYYRIAGIRLHLPPLRERSMDIPEIANVLLDGASRAFGKSPRVIQRGGRPPVSRTIPGPAMFASCRTRSTGLWSCPTPKWLGRICWTLGSLTARGGIRPGPGPQDRGLGAVGRIARGTLKERVEAMEAEVLRETLIRHRWNRTQAAEELGLSRVGLRAKIERYQISR